MPVGRPQFNQVIPAQEKKKNHHWLVDPEEIVHPRNSTRSFSLRYEFSYSIFGSTLFLLNCASVNMLT